MPSDQNDSPKPKPTKKIRDKGFAKRLEIACENNPNCPTDEYRGKQKWIYDNLESRYGVRVSPEAVRKWFAGETQPRRDVLNLIAQILEVDPAWLSLGITPEDKTPQEKRKRNAIADGVVNYLAGLIQLSGGSIAFPEGGEADDVQPDLFAIIKGKQYAFQVKKFQPAAETHELRIRVPTKAENHVVIGVAATDSPLVFDVIRLSTDVIAKHGKGRGSLVELNVTHKGSKYLVGDEETLPKVTDFSKF